MDVDRDLLSLLRVVALTEYDPDTSSAQLMSKVIDYSESRTDRQTAAFYQASKQTVFLRST